MHDLITLPTATQSLISIAFELILGTLGVYLAVLKIRRARRRSDVGHADSDQSRRPGVD
jgi:hypothetical protein